PARTVKEFVALAKRRSLTYSSSGAGGSNHFAMELLGQTAGFRLIHVPYKGIAPAVVGLIGGDVDATIASSPGVMTQVRAGRARAIAVSSAERTPLAPGLPTIAESGVPGYSYENWWGLFAPAKVPAPVLNTINASVNKVLVGADMKQLLEREGAAA